MIYKCPCCNQPLPDLDTITEQDDVQSKLDKEYQDLLSTTLWFGKYAGKSIQYVLDINPEYLLWVKQNVTQITLSERLVTEASNRASASRDRIPTYRRSTPSYYDHHEYDTDYDALDDWGDMDPMD